MSDLARHLSEVSPEKRMQLTKLLKARASRGAPAPPATKRDSDTHTPLMLGASSLSEPSALKASYKQFYDSVSSQLNASDFGQFSYFLNFGYVPNGSPDCTVIDLPEHFINKNSVRLVLELIGDCTVDGSDVLDVGCGRGGTIYTLKTFFEPKTLTGLDLSTTAVEFDRKAHGDARTSFHEGDAENLPFADESFDIVTNVESSHSYPNVHRFYAEVHRVLRPGGYFLYTDALVAQQIATTLTHLDHFGFQLELNRNITSNVVLSCNEVAATRVGAFDRRNDPELMQNFLAIPGSQVYDEMCAGRWEYRIFRLRKRGSRPFRE